MRNLLVVLFLLFTFTSIAQDRKSKQITIESKILVIAHGGGSLPFGDFKDSHSFGINFGLSADVKVANNFYPGVTIDDQLFFGKKIPGFDEHYKKINQIRLLAAPRITTNGNIGIAITPELGVSIDSYSGQSDTEFTYGAKVDFPILKDIPFFARLFRTKDNTFLSAGLMIFITPKVTKSE